MERKYFLGSKSVIFHSRVIGKKIYCLSRKVYFFTMVTVLMYLLTACGKTISITSYKEEPKVKNIVTVHFDDDKQVIHSFGASDCWTAKFVGKWMDIQKKNYIADLLFSLDTLPDGSPKGIGLSLWRFNIGSGSFEQGISSNIADEWRREECFLNENGSYDWHKQQGQQWFLQAAKQRGVKYTLGFSLTPPVFMAQNGKAYNSSGTTQLNIQDGKSEAYADFMVRVTEHFGFDYLSPVNEPQWTWGKVTGASQEGTQANNKEIASLVKLLSPKLAGTNAEIVIGEAGQWDFLYGRNSDGRGDQISQFFSPYSSNYIGNLPNVAQTISSHSYFTTCPDDNMIHVRNMVAAQVKQVDPGIETWQTEFGVLGNICDQYSGSPRNTGIDYGIYVAKVLHHDLTIANVTSWQWWLAMSPYNYSDALVYINAPSGQIDISGSKNDGIISESGQLWAFGNFARFVRPGMRRVGVSVSGINSPEEAAGKLMVSAYKDTVAKKIVFVIINPQSIQKTVQLAGIAGNVNAYTTDNTRNLKKSVVKAEDVMVSPRSVMTLIGGY